jgi:hypothetical protein
MIYPGLAYLYRYRYASSLPLCWYSECGSDGSVVRWTSALICLKQVARQKIGSR